MYFFIFYTCINWFINLILCLVIEFMIKKNCIKNPRVILIVIITFFVDGNALAKFTFANQNSALKVTGSNSKFVLNRPVNNFSGTLDLKDNSADTIKASGSSLLSFQNGVCLTGFVSSIINGSFDPTGTDSIVLNDGDFFNTQFGTIVQPVTVASGASVTILGQPKFSSSITLGNASSVLQLGIVNELSQSIVGSGTVSLLNDLYVGQSVQLSSIVKNNGKKLSLAGTVFSQAINFSTGGIIELLTNASLTNSWTIGTGSDIYYLNGNGNVLDLSSSGSITFNGTTLYISNIVLRGLSDTNFLNGSGRIIFSNVVLEFAGNMTRSDGSYTFYGDPCKIISNGYLFIISGSGNEILIDGMVLRYDQLDGSFENPISAVSSAAVNFANGGAIESLSSLQNNNLLVYSTSYVLDRNFDVTTSSILRFVNASPGSPKSVAFDGGSNILQIPRKTGSYFVLDDNIQLTLSNVVLRDFYLPAFSLGSGASITFSTGVILELAPNFELALGDISLIFDGNATIDGKGTVFYLSKSAGIVVSGSNNLVFKNMQLLVSVADGINLVSDSSAITLQDVVLSLQSSGFLFSNGNLNISSFVRMIGNAGNNSVQKVTFEFASKGFMNVLSNAELKIEKNVNLKYNADPANDLTLYASKRHMVFSEIGSKLVLDGCSIESTNTGMAIDVGTVKILNDVVVETVLTPEAAFEIGINANFFIMSGANLLMNGIIRYSE